MKLPIFFALILLSLGSFGQIRFPEFSPKGTITQAVGFTTISISYERPSARGREIFGALVPFDKLWRTGAGHCTTLHFSKPVTLQGQKISAGTYSLFTVPGKQEWTIVLNADSTLYGYDNYDPAKDIVHFKVKPTLTAIYQESLTLSIDVHSNNAELSIAWCNTLVHFPIVTTTDEEVMQTIRENLLTGRSSDWNDYAAATQYYLYNNLDLSQALVLANKAVEHNGELFSYDLQMRVLEKQKNYPAAMEAARHGLEYIRKFGTKLGYAPIEATTLEAEIQRLKGKQN